jgi:hypothetical protein
VKQVASGLAALVLAAGCTAPGGPQAGGGRYTVRVAATPFYHHGPAQAVGPDFVLKEGTPLTVVHREFGFSRIMLDNGQSGYVATQDITAALPTPTPAPTPARSAERPSHAVEPPLPEDGEESIDPLDLPKTLRPQTPPAFRY